MLKWNVVDYQLFSKTEWLDEIPKWQDKIPELPDISIPRFNVKCMIILSVLLSGYSNGQLYISTMMLM
ncbi:hypothetical protein RCL_jg23862.t2 [Rhizophagus clarus]|uniref:Uncharacterized protein n=1 Tax=Rhizophagus clarus TaxID=94130 RepID=A0A8H3LP97_9GLOM|nr:hypothetical protein RCL_jg23862.t2 [Rhizophagus clarus]